MLSVALVRQLVTRTAPRITGAVAGTAPGEVSEPPGPPPADDQGGPVLPPGRWIDLPGRGETYVRDRPGPPGAPTVVLLHGLGATGDLNWHHIVPALEGAFRVVTLDHHGHGRGVRCRERFCLADCADDVAAVAEHLGAERIIPVGYSLGGPVAQLVWQRHRPLVAGLVLAATARNFRGRPHERLGHLAFAGALAFAHPVLATTAGRSAQLAMLPMSGRHEHGAWARAQMARSDWGQVVRAAEALGRFSSHGWIGQVDVPTAVVVTTRDRLVPPSRQLRLARSVPGATVHLADATHHCIATEPATVRQAIVDACRLVALRAGSPTQPAARSAAA